MLFAWYSTLFVYLYFGDEITINYLEKQNKFTVINKKIILL